MVAAAVGLALAGGTCAAGITGGGDATPQAAPFQVGIEASGRFVCGGFLRDADTVITAAHCIRDRPAATLTVRFDGLDRMRLAQSRGVALAVEHPRFSWASGAADATLLKLSSPATPSPTIAYAQLATSDPAPGTEVIVTGWGLTRPGHPAAATTLKALRERVTTPAACGAAGLNGIATLLAPGDTTPTGALCAAPPSGAGFCQGDSGGPASIDGTVVGIVSRNKGCAAGSHDTYTSVAYLNGWLSQPL